MHNNMKGIAFTLFGASLWGFSGSCGQYLFTAYGFDAKWLTSVRMTTAGIILTLFTLIKEREKTFDIFKNKKDLLTLLVLAFAGLLLAVYLFKDNILFKFGNGHGFTDTLYYFCYSLCLYKDAPSA